MATEESMPTNGGSPFDFTEHRRQAVHKYEKVRGLYEECADAVGLVLEEALEAEAISVHSVEARAKSVESFGTKCEKPNKDEPTKPKYPEPLKNITDLSGVRAIVFLLDHVAEVGKLVKREFHVVRGELVSEPSGYRGVHYEVRFSDSRKALPEYARFADCVTEIQVRTVLQHAWAEVEHGIVYKAKAPVPAVVREHLVDLAGALKVADRGLQAVSSENTSVGLEGLSK